MDQGEGSLGGAFDEVPASPRVAAPPVYIEKDDALAPAFGGAALAAAGVAIFGIFVLVSAVLGTRPPAVEWFATKNITIWAGAGMGFGAVLLFFVFGLIIGRLVKR